MNMLSRIGAAPAAVAVSLTALTAAPARAGEVTLTNDDVITGVITEKNDQEVVVEHADLGTLDIPMSNIAGVTLEEGVDPVWVAPPVPDFFTGWDKNITVGISGSSGNTEAFNLYASFDTGYEDENDRWDIFADAYYSQNEGVNTTNYYQVGLIKDWLNPGERHFYWLALKHEQDRFTGYRERTSGYAGIGYELVEDKDYTLIGRLGAGAAYEAGNVDDLTAELFVGLEGEWTIDENSSLNYYTYFYPSLDPAFEEFRNTTGVDYAIAIDKAKGMSLKIGAKNEYNSAAIAGTRKNDLKYYAALGIDFQ